MSADALATGRLTVNGDEMPLAGLGTVGDLLAALKIAPQRVVVELNGIIYRRGEGLRGRPHRRRCGGDRALRGRRLMVGGG